MKPKRWSSEEAKGFIAAVEDMEALRVIKRSSSPYAANSRLIPKKGGGGLRPIVNYMPVNSRIEMNAGPLPNMDDLRAMIPPGYIFSTMDLAKGVLASTTS